MPALPQHGETPWRVLRLCRQLLKRVVLLSSGQLRGLRSSCLQLRSLRSVCLHLRGLRSVCSHLLRHVAGISLILLCQLGILWVGLRHGRWRKLVLLPLPVSYKEERGKACDGDGSHDANDDARYCAAGQGIGRGVVVGGPGGIRGGCHLCRSRLGLRN
jgi:hypothetical protein